MDFQEFYVANRKQCKKVVFVLKYIFYKISKLILLRIM